MRSSLLAPSQTIDCETCAAPRERCRDCIVSVLAHLPADGEPAFPLDAAEARAVGILCAQGLVPEENARLATARRERLNGWAATG